MPVKINFHLMSAAKAGRAVEMGSGGNDGEEVDATSGLSMRPVRGRVEIQDFYDGERCPGSTRPRGGGDSRLSIGCGGPLYKDGQAICPHVDRTAEVLMCRKHSVNGLESWEQGECLFDAKRS